MTLDPTAFYLTAPPFDGLSGVRHAFFTRGRATCDAGIYGGLNCGFGSADSHAVVRANRARAMAALGQQADALAMPHQVHGAKALIVHSPGEVRGQKADAVVTDRPGIVLGVLTADCAPVLFCDPVAGTIAAAHAGWKGARFGVVAAVLAAMQRLGARRSRIRAAIGPTIGPLSYEVGPEFAARFLSERSANARFFRRVAGAARARFDLPGYLTAQLRAAGLAQVADLTEDTVGQPARFFSYRRSVSKGKPNRGLQLSAIVLKR